MLTVNKLVTIIDCLDSHFYILSIGINNLEMVLQPNIQRKKLTFGMCIPQYHVEESLSQIL